MSGTETAAPETAGAPGAPAASAPDRVRPPFTRRTALFLLLAVGGLGLVGYAWHGTGFGFTALFSGLGDMWTFLKTTVPPTFSSPDYSLGAMLKDAETTTAMALLGTTLALVLSVPLGFLAARNTSPHPAVRVAARAVITLCRAVPDLLFALIFRDALGVGVLPGVLALGLHSVGMLGKVYADAIEQAPTGPYEAVRSTGAGRLQTIVTAVFPFAAPTVVSTALYRLDINLRSSVVLGFAGAGGIGFMLQAELNTLQFRHAMGIVIVITVLILLMELVSAAVRSALIGSDQAATPRRGTKVLTPIVVLALLGYAWFVSGIPLSQLASAPAQIWSTLARFFPPDFTTARSQLISGMNQSLLTAIVGTFVGGLIALPVAFLAARNIARPWVYGIVRVLLVLGRSVPELIIAVMFVVAVGPGVLAGVFALIAGTVAFLAKLMADSLEEAAPGPREAVRSAGAGPVQEIVTTVVPAATPGIVANLLYMLDINFRASALLGIVGAGGIGFLLSQTIQTFEYRTTGAIVLMTFAVVLVIEQVSNWIRKRLA